MEEGHEDDNTTKPSVHEVVGIKTYLKERDERVVAACKDDERDHVDHRQHAGSSTQLSNDRVMVLLTPVELKRVSKVAGQVKEDQDRVES